MDDYSFYSPRLGVGLKFVEDLLFKVLEIPFLKLLVRVIEAH
jgi:hypothetical protein